MRFYSRGKLLIAGEYLVLKGAKALAVPLTKGQDLTVEKSNTPGILFWNSRELGNTWFTAKFDISLFQLIETSDPKIADGLLNILKTARDLNPDFLADKQSGFQVTTNLEFRREWGFGSSSSLISNIADWAKIDPMALHRKVSNGSGYDIMAARRDGPFFFQIKDKGYTVKDIKFLPDFLDKLFFVYLGKKQRSNESVEQFLKDGNNYSDECKAVSEIAKNMVAAKSLSEFELEMKRHEQLMSQLLKMDTLKQSRFNDLPGEVKALGAWGGDFALLSWNDNPENLKGYLEKKNIDTCFSYKSIVKY